MPIAPTSRTHPRRAVRRELACPAWRLVSIASVMLIAFAALPVHPAMGASQIFVALDYQVPSPNPGCGDANAFRDSVQRQLGYDPFRTQADRHVAVRVARIEGGYEGRVQWTDARGRNVGERKLSTRRAGCAEIVNNVAFAVAVQIQLLAAVAEPPASPSVAAAPPLPPPPPPAVAAPPPSGSEPAPAAPRAAAPATETTPPATAPPPDDHPAATAPRPPATVVPEPPAPAPVPTPPRERLRLSMGLGPSLALRLAPRPTATGRLFVDGQVRWFSLEVSFDGALPVERKDTNAAGFSLQRYGGEGAACGHGRALGACITGGVGYLRASGLGLDDRRTATGFSAQTGARFVATHDLGVRYFAALRVEGIVQLSRWTVTINDGAVWSTPRLAGFIGVDVGARIFR